MSYTLPRKFYIIAVMGKKVCSRENGYHTMSSIESKHDGCENKMRNKRLSKAK